MTDHDDERWTPPIGPVDPEHPECAAVIAGQAGIVGRMAFVRGVRDMQVRDGDELDA